MKQLRKVVPPSRIILDDIWLSFYPGRQDRALLAANGAGKSSLSSAIMAGVDQEFQGEAWAAKGTRIGYLAQEPSSIRRRTSARNVEEAVKEQRALLDEFNRISNSFGESMSDEAMTKSLESPQAKCRADRISTIFWNLATRRDRHGRASVCPPGDAEVTHLSEVVRPSRRAVRVCEERTCSLLDESPQRHDSDAESVAWPRALSQGFWSSPRRTSIRRTSSRSC